MNTKLAPRKPDPMFEPGFGLDIHAARIQSALWEFDMAMNTVDNEWGHDRLPYLVSPDTREKWWRATAALWDAVRKNDPEIVTEIVGNLITKGIPRLREEATRAKAEKTDARVMETALPSGGTLCIVQSWPEHAHRPEPRPDVHVYTIEEIARLIDSQFSLVNKTKELFADAKVVRPRNELLDDEVPF